MKLKIMNYRCFNKNNVNNPVTIPEKNELNNNIPDKNNIPD